MPRLAATFQISGEPDRYRDEYSDRMGGFPNGGTNGNGNSVAERHGVGEELQRRALGEVAKHIDQLLDQHHPDGWGLAAPSEIASAVVEKIRPDCKASLRSVVKHDLINADAKALIHQFTEASALH
jgi:hypothetical protein